MLDRNAHFEIVECRTAQSFSVIVIETRVEYLKRIIMIHGAFELPAIEDFEESISEEILYFAPVRFRNIILEQSEIGD